MGRVAGFPTSSNRASSFHLSWQLPSLKDSAGGATAITAVAVTLEILEPPSVERLYFWALQADFADESGRHGGGAHLGLQWHPGHPESTAVNWGGYDHRGMVLSGSESALPSKMANPHTRDFVWHPRVPYRLRIERVASGEQTAWRGTVTDLSSSVTTIIRDLHPAGDHISGVTMWSEVFARCDDPSVAIRWSHAEASIAAGTQVLPSGFRVNYQSHQNGGCANSDSSCDEVGIVQRTTVQRDTLQGQVIRR
jgi:hypothetical protein